MRVAVVCGGESSERDVSLSSGLAVARALIERDHEVVLIDPAQEQPILAGPTRDAGGLPRYAVPEEPPDLSERAAWRRRVLAALAGGPVHDRLRAADMVFLALHGGWGEDGHVQALLEMAGIPFTGASSAACAAAWHKDRALACLQCAGLPTAERIRYRAADGVPVTAEALVQAGPVVVKPVADGSSVDVQIVASVEELLRVTARLDHEELLIEPFLSGREFTVGVVGNRAMPVIEIELATPLFDYRAKYQPGAAREVCPAEIPDAFAQRLQGFALAAHQTLGFGPTAYSRTDFRADAAGEPTCLEVNALPGLTPGSLLPLAAKAAGWAYPELIDRILTLKPIPALA